MWVELLPIAGRELRVAARRPGTLRFRAGAAVLAIIASVIWLLSFPAWAAAMGAAASLFGLQTACAFGLALLSGPFLASDCFSEEKRDGTLGLLFLAGLKAREVVLGKFLGTSLTTMYALLALLPITALPMILGGVGALEFTRMVLALLNTLFFSLATGLAVSAFVTSYAKGVAATLAILTLTGAVAPVLAELASKAGWPIAGFCLACYSPFYPFWFARDTAYVLGPHKFWVALLAGHFAGWLALALAGSRVRCSWHATEAGLDRSVAELRPARRRSQNQNRRAAAGSSFDPVLSLTGEPRPLRRAAWLIVVAWGALLYASRSVFPQPWPAWLAASAFAFLFKVLVAFQACRFFVEARRNGALELLLCTPLRNSDLIRAQWHAVLRVFLGPLIIFLALAWLAIAFNPARATLGSTGAPRDALTGMRTGGLGAALLTIRLAADILATGWFGMWLALTLRTPGVAPGLTVFAVLILPMLLSQFSLVTDMLFISWGTTRLQEDFRQLADTTLTRNEAPA
jgi:ABC-type transport system involved in cytochrome c biogenesis permease component